MNVDRPEITREAYPISSAVYEAQVEAQDKSKSVQGRVYCFDSENIHLYLRLPDTEDQIASILEKLGVTSTIRCTDSLASSLTVGIEELGMNPGDTYLHINSLNGLKDDVKGREFRERDLNKFCRRIKKEMGLSVQTEHEFI